MKKKYLFAVLFTFVTFVGFSQGDKDLCPRCDQTNFDIINNGENSYTALTAQAYYWSVCGNNSISIVGSNTSQAIQLSGPVGSTTKLYLTRFVGGNCVESCKNITIVGNQPPSCNSCQMYISVMGNVPNGFCDGVIATLNNCDQANNISYVEWSYAVAGTECPIAGCPLPGTSTSVSFSAPTSIYSPGGDYSYLVIWADVYYNDGTMCNYSASELLICDQNYTTTPPKSNKGGDIFVTFSPNPTKTGSFSIKGIDLKKIESLEIYNLSGEKQIFQQDGEGKIDVRALMPGVYVIKIMGDEGEIIQKKLIVQ